MTTKQYKEYSLLRPFDSESIQIGDLLCNVEDSVRYEFLGIGKKGGADALSVRHVVDDLVGGTLGNLYICSPESVRIAPIAWVENKPVYPEDVLYYKDTSLCSGKMIAKKARDSKTIFGWTYFDYGDEYTDDGAFDLIEMLTWENPKKSTLDKPKTQHTGWMNIYPVGTVARLADRIWPTKEEAEFATDGRHVATVQVTWEE